MHNKSTLYGLAAILALILFLSNRSGAPAGHTGAPDEATCGRSFCHNVPENAGNAILDVSIDASTYIPGMPYTVNVQLSNNNPARNGFQIVALNDRNEMAGSWTLLNDERTRVVEQTTLQRSYVTHTSTGSGESAWTMSWTAPAEDVGEVIFYAAANDANGNGASSGDRIYTQTLALPSDATSVSESTPVDNVKIYPNPAFEFVRVEGIPVHDWRIRVVDNNGLELDANLQHNIIDLGEWPAGIYYLTLENGAQRIVRKLIKSQY